MSRRLATLSLALCGCSAPPSPPVAKAPPAPVEAPAPPSPPPPRVDPPIQDCGQDPAKESPIVEGSLGEGDRVVRLFNNSATEIQARLLDASKTPAVPGTLHVPPNGRGEFHVPEGIYMVRYRYGKNCQVRRGGQLILQGRRAGVEISIRPVFDEGTRANMKPVEEPL